MIPPASLRSDRDRHRIGISARDQIGITDRLRRNQQFRKDTGELGDPEVDESLVQSRFVRPSLH